MAIFGQLTTKQKQVIGLFIIIIVIIWIPASASTSQNLGVSFLNVGQGDAIFITAPNGNQMLIDGGPDSSVLAELGEQMKFSDRSIDVILATHADADHIGGLPDILAGYKIGTIITPCVPADTGLYDEFETAVAGEPDVRTICAQRGMRIMLDERAGVFADILFPDRDMSDVRDRNDSSIIVKLTYGDIDFLFTGDASQTIENYLSYIGSDDLDIEILKLGHHGSKTSTSDLFLQNTSPEMAVVSAGAGNRYGHPHDEVIDALTSRNIPSLSTARDGQ
ncbi:MAG: MBL fold metallo-hydrolase, partial [Candidatus Nomurabacteria bacterium]|nr:MBL fold metallo-hydrolase [Candidatus Nomurabacteria bacterium]